LITDLSYELQACGFIQAEHQVHVLHGLAGGAFHEVVDGGEDDDLFAARGETDVAEVGRLHPVDVGEPFTSRTKNESR
jgi:hypothetical protein